jgi:hypothetical protein
VEVDGYVEWKKEQEECVEWAGGYLSTRKADAVAAACLTNTLSSGACFQKTPHFDRLERALFCLHSFWLWKTAKSTERR